MSPPSPELPRYLQIANELERRIEGDLIRPGPPFPSEQTLMDEFTVSRGTARKAIETLGKRGRIYTIAGVGSFVRPPVPVLRLMPERYRYDLDSTPENPQSSFTAENGIPWEAHNPDVKIVEEPASAEIAALFEVEEGVMLSRRNLVFRFGNYPTHMSTSYYLLDMVAGTWVVGTGSEPSPGGAIGHLRSLGVQPTAVVEEIGCREPTAEESATLLISSGPVLTITRRTYAGDRVVEVAHEIVIPGNSTKVVVRVNLT